MSTREEILDRLNDVHSFPGEYVFKVIGENTTEFVTRIVQACINALKPGATPGVRTRESSGGRHVSVTLTVQVEDAEEVLRVYDMMGKLEGIKFIL